MKFCYNTNFTLPKQYQRSRSVLQDGSNSLGLFWKEKTPSYNRRNTVDIAFQTVSTIGITAFGSGVNGLSSFLVQLTFVILLRQG